MIKSKTEDLSLVDEIIFGIEEEVPADQSSGEEEWIVGDGLAGKWST